jgi:hypothetical protein
LVSGAQLPVAIATAGLPLREHACGRVEDRFKHHALRRGPTDDPESFKAQGKVGDFASICRQDIAYIDNAWLRGAANSAPGVPARHDK